jgi:methylmalonyl-CoA/ethylmalonyl-CoA epimerase
MPLFLDIHEIAVAVQDVDAAATAMAALFQAPADPPRTVLAKNIGIRQQGVWIGPTRLTMIEDAPGSDHVSKSVHRRGEGLHQLCVRTTDLDAAIRHFRSLGVRLLSDTPTILEGFRWGSASYAGARSVFIHPASAHGVLIEVQEWLPGT